MTSAPPSSTQMPAPGANFTIDPAGTTSVTPWGTTTQWRTTVSTGPTTTMFHVVSRFSRPPSTRVNGSVSVRTSASPSAPASVCHPSSSPARRHSPAVKAVPSQVAPSHGCTRSTS